MITNINDDLKVCGIYKINYDNGKIYIGQALSIWSRANEHNSKNIQICDRALKMHSATIEILEIVSDVLQLDEIESKWINYYNATDKNIGYNILKNGNASGKNRLYRRTQRERPDCYLPFRRRYRAVCQVFKHE